MSRTLRRNNQIPVPSASLVDAPTSSHRLTLLSPPETDPMQDHYNSAHEDNYSPPDHLVHDTPVPRTRRLGMPNVAYTNDGLSIRETRSPQRHSKWLIVVCPPKSLNKEPPMLGHTLSTAPAGRFSSGILVPLFPTLYAQLTAIAREFNMPSVTGLCLYLQLQENVNPTLTPRLSDETWQILWASYFADDKSPLVPSHGLPICGRIEFDIDLRRAKWYNTWMGLTSKDPEGISRDPSIVPTHWRGESRTSFFHPEINPDDHPSPQETLLNPTRRQAPRPLLLGERESLHQRSSSRHSIRNIFQDASDHENSFPDASTTAHKVFIPNALSPMVQELEEPQSGASLHLKTFVKKWRESSIIASSPPSTIEASGQPSLNPVHLPSSLDADLKLDLNDYSWSISSAGPPSQSPASPGWPERLPSIHLEDRMQMSKCSTPTTCTTWGPPVEDEEISDSSSCRLPSPDLGYRTLDYVPLTPSTCTTWGPYDLPSPIFSHSSTRALSVDIGARVMDSVPVTPSTCTTWGPANLPSPILSERSLGEVSVDLGMRGRGSVSTSPTAISLPLPDASVLTPWTATHILSLDKGEHLYNNSLIVEPNSPWLHVWPYAQSSVSSSVPVPWPHVWPYAQSTTSHGLIECPVQLGLEHYPELKALYRSPSVGKITVLNDKRAIRNNVLSYPFLQIYESVYPYNLSELYPEISCSILTTLEIMSNPAPNPPLLYTLADSNVSGQLGHNSHDTEASHPVASFIYPFFDIYPPVYPYSLELIYPVIAAFDSQLILKKGLEQSDSTFLEVHPSFYPTRDLEGTHTFLDAPVEVDIISNAVYPQFDLYPAMYPFSLESIYPKTSVDLHYPSERGDFEASYAEYPFFSIYPAVYPFNLTNIYFPVDIQVPLISEKVQPLPLAASLKGLTVSQYPSFDLYPAAYPCNVTELYPSVVAARSSTVGITDVEAQSSSMLSNCQYPWFDIYPAVYPYSLVSIYPALSPQSIAQGIERIPLSQARNASIARLDYPSFDIYPAVTPCSADGAHPSTTTSYSDLLAYPQIELYGTVYGQTVKTSSNDPLVASVLVAKSNSTLEDSMDNVILSRATTTYPFIDIYPQIGSHSDEYADLSTHFEPELRVIEGLSMSLPVSYPIFEIYPPVYPYSLEIIYSPTSLTEDLQSTTLQHPREQAADYGTYPHLAPYPSGYPWSLNYIYESNVNESGSEFGVVCSPVVMEYSQGCPTFSLYPHSGYPEFVLYPDTWDGTSAQTQEKLAAPVIMANYPVFDIYPAQYPFITIYPSVLTTMDYPVSQPLSRSIEYQYGDVRHRYPFLEIYPSVYPNFDLYPGLQTVFQDEPLGSSELKSAARVIATKRLSYQNAILPDARSGFEHSTPPPIPVKPQTLKSVSRSNSLKASKPPKRRRTHHELYMAVIGDIRHALEEPDLFKKIGHDVDKYRSPQTSQKPSLLRKPSVAVARYTTSPFEGRIASKQKSMHSDGSPSPPGQTQSASTFTGHVSTSIHNRIQSMHLQSLSKPKDETDRSGLERSKSLTDRTRTNVLDRARIFSAAHEKGPPPIPSKPSLKFGKPKSSYA